MFAHMFIRLIIQNRFHCSYRTLAFEIHGVIFSLLRCLLLPSPSIFVACAVEFQVGVLRSRGFFGVISSPCEDWQFGILVFAVLFAWEMAWDSPIVNIVLQMTKTQLFMSALVIDGNLKLLSVECCLETKMCRDVNYCMTSWRTPSDIYK